MTKTSLARTHHLVRRAISAVIRISQFPDWSGSCQQCCLIRCIHCRFGGATCLLWHPGFGAISPVGTGARERHHQSERETGSNGLSDYEALLGEAGASNLLARRGRLFVWTTKRFAARIIRIGNAPPTRNSAAKPERCRNTGARARDQHNGQARSLYPDAGHLLNLEL